MAAIMMKSSVMVKASAPSARPAVSLKASVSMKIAAPKVVAFKANQMQVWREDNNKQFETFSFLPPLTPAQISKQIDYIVSNGWVPCLEFASPENAYVSSRNCERIRVTPGYYDNRYWTMWKLPMFGCSDASQVLKEISSAAKALPAAYIRIAAFDNIRQVQICSFLVQRPVGCTEYREPNDRQIA